MSSGVQQVRKEARVLIVGTGLVGSLTCYHLRNILKKEVRIDMSDMARGAGGRMSTTRFGDNGTRANTGAQYVSCCSPEAATLLASVCSLEQACGMDRIEAPERRSTHFNLQTDGSYAHWLPHDGTNAVVKQFLHAGQPDSVVFESRLQQVAASPELGTLLPIFDRGGLHASGYSAMILAMPPKDILKFFDTGESERHDPQSQADLHRRTNRGRGATSLPPGYRHVSLPSDVVQRLRTVSYVGRFSLALWFDKRSEPFIRRLSEAWGERREPHAEIDLISQQPGGVFVVQSTVEFWRRQNSGKGGRGRGGGGRGGGGSRGGHEAARAFLVAALEDLAGDSMPRPLNAKLLNWRTSQADRVLPPSDEGRAAVVTAEEGRLIFTGDWCVESSFEGCNRAALAAASAAKDTLTRLLQQ